jgi:PAS domain S-box-containing protein
MQNTDNIKSWTVYKIVFNTIQEGLILTDMEGVIRNVNPRTEALFGYNRAELIGLAFRIQNRRLDSSSRFINRNFGRGSFDGV